MSRALALVILVVSPACGMLAYDYNGGASIDALDGGPTDGADAGADAGDGGSCVVEQCPAKAASCAGADLVEYVAVCRDDACAYDERVSPCDAPPGPACEGSTLVTSAAGGTCQAGACTYPRTETDCAERGCHAAEARCRSIVPTNGARYAAAFASTDVVLLTTTHSFNTDTCGDGVLGACTPVEVPDAPDACVCRAASYDLRDRVVVSGARALVLWAEKTVSIAGRLDATAFLQVDGSGAEGLRGPAATGLNGGRGGTWGTRGGEGASAAVEVPVGADLGFSPLVGGRRGQDGCGTAHGGGGGGAVQIIAGEKIVLTGSVEAGGGGGHSGDQTGQCLGAGGGGSGGTILLEAPLIESIGTSTLAANGGSGGGGSTTGTYGGAGDDALPSIARAVGGEGADGRACLGVGTATIGGDGGDGSTSNLPGENAQGSDTIGCATGTLYVGGGGGGGGGGRIRLNAATCRCSGLTTPPAIQSTVTLQ